MKKLLILALFSFTACTNDPEPEILVRLSDYQAISMEAHWEFVHDFIGTEGKRDSTVGNLEYRSYKGKGGPDARMQIVWEPNRFNVSSKGMVKSKSQTGLTD